MKKSYIKILILEIVLILIIIFNNFVLNNKNAYLLVAILLIGLLILKLLLGNEKNNYSKEKDTILSIIIYTLSALLFTYILGIFISFSKTPNYLNINGVLKYIIPTILIITISEVFRGGLTQKSEGSKILIILTTILFIIIDIILKINNATFISSYSTLMFIAYYLLPSIAKNILCMYIAYKVGYKPAIIYRLIMEMYTYIIPIIPDFGEYINSIIRLIIPSILLLILMNTLKEEKIKETIYQEVNLFDKLKSIFVLILISSCVYLTSGSFTYFSMAIGSGSMSKLINKGDIVIAKKLKEKDKRTVKKGDILIYKYGNTIIVHRIVDIYKNNNEFIVYTKGDANEKMDSYPIYENMMIGIVKTHIPFLGYPTIVINNTIN